MPAEAPDLPEPGEEMRRVIAKFMQSLIQHVLCKEGLQNDVVFKRFKRVPLCEFKAHPHRLLGFEVGETVFLARHFVKPKGDKQTDRREIKRALAIRLDHLAWMETVGLDTKG